MIDPSGVPFYLLAFSLTLFIAAAGTPAVAALARRIGAISYPRTDRWHQSPTPVLGGIAIFVAILIGALLMGPHDGRLVGLLLGATMVFVLGLVDDLRGVPPQFKLLGQIAAACTLIVSGVRIELSNAPFLAGLEFAVTVIWVIGITNAFNLLDNMDGLSAGIAMIAGVMLFGHSAASDHTTLAVLGLVIAGAAAGFLIHNFHPATIFMGDCGSMTLGLTLAGVALMSTQALGSNAFAALAVPVAILGLPIFDTSLVTIARQLHGRPVGLGGRDHLSHRLVALGLSERGAVLVLYALAAGLGALGLLAIHAGFWTTLATGALVAVAVILFGVFLGQVRIYAEQTQDQPLAVASGPWAALRPDLWWRPEVAAMALDVLLIAIAYLLAYLLKYEADFGGPFLSQFAESLPYLVAIKLAVLVLSRSYRTIWRYFSTADAFILAMASAAGSVASVVAVALATGFVGYSRSVFVIDWLLLTALLVGSRISFALLGDWFARLPRAESTRVLILGADDRGDLVLRSIMRNASYRAVGFLDSDPAKQQRRLRGVPVLGTPRDILSVAVATGAHEVVIATPLPAGQEQARFTYLCHELGVEYREAAAFLRQHLPQDPSALEAEV